MHLGRLIMADKEPNGKKLFIIKITFHKAFFASACRFSSEQGADLCFSAIRRMLDTRATFLTL